MFEMPGIILVDNDEQELSKLQDAFFKSGIPCLPINYKNDPENFSGIDHVDIPSTLSPRVLISDLNLQDTSKLDALSLVGPLAEVIKKTIKSGPYILGIWSKHEKEPQEVIDLLQSRFSSEIILPIGWTFISKNVFLNLENNDASDTTSLNERIQNLLKETPLFYALLNWEGRISSAAKRTTSTLFSLAKPAATTETASLINAHQENLSKILASIANETLGIKNASDHPCLALDSGLAPVLADQLLEISNEDNNSIWRDAAPLIGSNIEIDSNIKKELNSFYHIEAVQDDYPKNCRGVLVQFDPSYLEAPSNKASIKKKLGREIKTIITEEFINCNVGDRNSREEVRASIVLGFLEVSAECDQAQKKTKLNRYLLAALIPSKYEEYTFFGKGEAKRDTQHGGIYRLPCIKFREESYILKISFKYQFGITPKDNKWIGRPLLRIRDQVLNDIVYSASHYSARPGIVRFD